MERECSWCGRKLSSDNSGKLCFSCADKLKNVMIDLPEILDVEQLAKLLHVDEETIRRKHRRYELLACIPSQKKLLWLKSSIMDYLQLGEMFLEANVEETWAILTGLKLGYPIGEATSYGHDTGKLIADLKATGHFPPGDTNSRKPD